MAYIFTAWQDDQCLDNIKKTYDDRGIETELIKREAYGRTQYALQFPDATATYNKHKEIELTFK